jgi:hypothetical protein
MAEQPRGGGSANQGPGGEGARFVHDIVKDPAHVPDVMRLYGYLGASSEAHHERLYLTPDLSSYVEVPTEAILHRMAMPPEQDPHGGTVLWVRQGAALQQKTSAAATALAHYFAGAMQAAAAAGPAPGAAQPLPVETVAPALCVPSQVCSLPLAVCGHTVVGCPPPSPPVVCVHSPPVICAHSPPIACLHTIPAVCHVSVPVVCQVSPPAVCNVSRLPVCHPTLPVDCPPRSPEILCTIPGHICPLPQAAAQVAGQPAVEAATLVAGCATLPAICHLTLVHGCPTTLPAVCQHSVVIACPPPTPPVVCQHSPFIACHPTLIGCPPRTIPAVCFHSVIAVCVNTVAGCQQLTFQCPLPGGSLACGVGPVAGGGVF